MARKRSHTSPLFEELEPRLLFSADIAEAFAAEAVVEEYAEEPAIIVELEEEPAANGTAPAPPEEIPPPAPETAEEPDAAETNTSNQPESEGIDAPLPAGEPADTTADNESATGESSEKSGSSELVIVNDNVKDHDQLTTAILEADESRSIEVLILNSEEDGIQQVTSVLDGQSDLDAIHFITHGRDGFLSLGSDWLDKSDLLENSETIATWGDALSADGDILFYGCSIAADETGEEFIDLLSELTGADISASDDKTGHDNLGGDWDLEYSTGSTEADSPLSAASQQGWGNLLSGTVADDFSSGDFSTSTGTIPWTNDWQEIGESDGYDYGNVLVYPHVFYGSQPLLSLWKTDGIGVWREADLSGASYGVLSFDYAHYMTEATDSVIVDISTDGSTWDVLADLRFVGTHDELQSTSYDISPYISATTQIRFRTINFSANDDFLLDNIFIELAPNVLTVNTTNDTVDGNTGSIAALLADPGADGISLREAILATNNTDGADVINFDIGGTGPHTISVGSGGLPAITDTVLIDGTSEPDFSGTPIIELEGSGAGASADGIVIGDGSLAGSGSTIRGLVINSFGGAGIYVMNADDVTIQGNFIGTDVSGVLDRGNSDDGISVLDSDRIQIGGTSQADRNIISYNGRSGIFLWGGTNDGIIEGNYIGTDITGLSAAGNNSGVEIADDTSDGNRIGGATPGAGNLISGNLSEGIYIYGADNTEIYGNLIGTDITGIAPLANGDSGIGLESLATNNQIGGVTPGEANIIAFNNHDGLHIVTAGNTIRANVIYSNTAPNQIHLGAGGNTTAATPAVSSATSSGGTTTVTVSVSGASGSTPYEVDLFSTATNDQQGQVYLGSVTVTGNPQVVVLNTEVTDGHFITATSTNTVGETSEFCNATPVTGPAISNIAPILDPTVDLALSPYIEDGALPAGPVGTLVRDIVGLQGEGTIENVIDPDASGVTGIAIIAADTTNGTWHYSTDDGAVWNPLGAVSIDSALLLAADNATTRIYFKPNASFIGTISEAIYFRAWDQSDNNSNGTSGIDTTLHSGTTAFSLMFDSASISALGEGNDAPVLSDDDHALTAIDEDIFDSAGDSVASIIVNGSISDQDGAAVESIAITAVDNSNGTWQYSLDNGSSWQGVDDGSLAVNHSLLLDGTLMGGSTHKLRFVPDNDFNGTASFTFRAWDMTMGDAGTYDTTSSSGGSTPYSTQTDTASITVIPVNDLPSGTGDLTTTSLNDTDVDVNLFENISVTDPDNEIDLSLTITLSNPGAGTLTGGGLTDLGGGVYTRSALTATDTNTALDGIQFTPVANTGASGTFTTDFTVVINDGESGDIVIVPATTVTITRVNDTPTAVTLDSLSVDENVAGAIVGSLTTTDPDTGDSHSYSVDDGRFEVVGGQLKLVGGQSLDHETEPTVDITVTATDSGSLTTSQLFTITVNDINDAPTAIALDNLTVDENTAGAIVGSLSTTDQDTGDTHTYTVDDGRFEVVAGQLKLAAGQSLDHETEPTVDITVTAIDSGSLTTNQLFTITVNDINDAPTAIALDSLSVDENVAGAIVGSLTTTDQDTGDSHSYTVDDVRFEVVAGQLKLVNGQSLDHETEPTVDITVTATDSGSLTTNQLFTITVNNVNDLPTAIALDNLTVDENTAGAIVGNLSTTDQDTGDTHTYTVDDGRFEVVGGQLKLVDGQSLDHETEPTVDITVTATDSGSLTTNQLFTISVNDVNEAPIITGDTTGSVTEDIDPDLDTLIETFGAMTIFDPDAGESSFTAETITGANGTLTIDSTGRWDYSADTTQTVIQQLDEGQIVTESFTVSTADGTTHVVTIDIHGAEDDPVMQTAIPDQVASEDLPFSFTFASSTFSDADSNDNLTYTATLSDDSPLPSWLSFNTATRHFSGTPSEADVGIVSIKVLASDGSSFASSLFTLSVANTNDTPLAADDSATTVQNSPVTTTDILANDTFGDGANFLLGFDSASTQGGTVIYNNDSTFTYTPATDFSGNDTFTYTISDSDGEVSSATVTITVTPGIVATPNTEETTETEETVEEIITATDTVEDTEPVEVSVVAEQEPAAQPEPVAAEAILEQSPAIEEAEEPGKPDVVTPNKNSDDSPAAPIDKPVNETHVKDHAEEYTTDDQQVMQVANVQARVDAQAQPLQKPEARQINQVQPATQDSSTTTLLLKRFLDRVKFNSEMEYSRAIMQLREALDEFQEEAENDVHFQKTVIGSAIAVSTGLSVGYVVWLIRGGMLLSSVLFSMPAWQIADPLPLLANSREDDEEDEETLESIIKRGAAGKGESPEADNEASL